MLNFRPLLFILGLFLSMLTAFMLIPLLLAAYKGEETVGSFMVSALVTGISSSLCLHNGQSKSINLNIRDMFLLTSLTWLIVSLFAAMPFTLYHGIGYTPLPHWGSLYGKAHTNLPRNLLAHIYLLVTSN